MTIRWEKRQAGKFSIALNTTHFSQQLFKHTENYRCSSLAKLAQPDVEEQLGLKDRYAGHTHLSNRDQHHPHLLHVIHSGQLVHASVPRKRVCEAQGQQTSE